MLGGKIIILFGENSYEKSVELAKLKQQAEKSNFEIENLNVDSLSKDDFVSAICGVSLFAEKRFVIAKNLSEKSEIWSELEAILARISSDVCFCLIEEKIDKRSSFYKNISKVADAREFKNLTTKDAKTLAEFARTFAKKQGLSLDLKLANFLVAWVGVNEWAVRNAVERLALLGEISEEKIREFIPQNVESNSFEVFETALRGNFEAVISQISKLKISEGTDGGYLFFGLISSQFFNLVALKLGKSAGKTTAEIAKEIGANAWALGKMENFASGFSQEELKQIAEKFAKTDEKLKNSSVDVWTAVEGLLLEIATKISAENLK